MSVATFTPWWSAYGLTCDPMFNAPVSEKSLDLLVRTPPIELLASYLSVETSRGGVYLVSGRYGAGKTTVLNSIPSLCHVASKYLYYDASVHRTPDMLASLFKVTAVPAAQSAIKSKLRPILAIDQLHNLDTQVAGDFFRSRQADFERLKGSGVYLVFAGDERFITLVKGGGPLGAIFDAEFIIPPFEDELARALLLRRFEAAAIDRESLKFPFEEDAISELVRITNGNPRNLIERARLVLIYCAGRVRPIRISVDDVRIATAEVTETALERVRHELRSPAVGNALAKLVKVESGPRGAQVIADLGRLLDLALERPSEPFEELTEHIRDLGIKPEVLTQTLVEVGLGSQEARSSKSKLGTTVAKITRVSKNGYSAIAAIRKDTGLLPSQYLSRVLEKVTVTKGQEVGDPLLTRLNAALRSATDERAQNFLSRGIEEYCLSLDPKTARPESVLGTVRDVARGLAIEHLGDSKGGSRELIERLISISPGGIVPSEGVLEAHFDRWEELRSRYEDRGEVWPEDDLKDAVKTGAIILRHLLRIDTGRRQAGKGSSEAAASSSVDAAITDFTREGRAWFEGQRLPDGPTIEAEARKLPRLLSELAKLQKRASADGFEFLHRALGHFDRLVYSRGMENVPDHLQGEVAAILEVLTARDATNESAINLAVKRASIIFSHVSEQGRPIVQNGAEPVKLSSFVQDTVQGPHSRADLAAALAFNSNVAQKSEIQERIHNLEKWFDQVDDLALATEAALVLWYFLRNVTSHVASQFQLLPSRSILARSFILALGASLTKTLRGMPQDFPSILLVRKRVTHDVYLVETSLGSQYAISSVEVTTPDIAVATTGTNPSGFDDVVWCVRKLAELGDIDAADDSRLSRLPPGFRLGLSWLKRRKNFSDGGSFDVFRAGLHEGEPGPTSQFFDGRHHISCRLKSISAGEDGETWLTSLGKSDACFLGLLTRVGSRDSEVIPYISLPSLRDLRRVSERLGFPTSDRFLPDSDKSTNSRK